jgi:hypothetical protein
MRLQSPCFTKHAPACPKGLVGSTDNLIQLLSPCQSLV